MTFFCVRLSAFSRYIESIGGVMSLNEEKVEIAVNNVSTSNVNRLGEVNASARRSETTKGEFAMLNVQRRNLGTVSLLNLDGNLVIGETDALHDIIQSLPSTNTVILDLSGVSLVDAHGMGVLLQMREQAHTRNMRFKLMSIGDNLRELFRITRLDSVFQISSGVEFLPLPALARRRPVAA